jgi:hypothetical protein
MAKNKKFQKFIDSALYKSCPVHSTSYIQHKVRVALGITNDEYILASLIQKLDEQDKDYTYDRIYNHIGMDEETVNACANNLALKKLIRTDDEKKRIIVTAVWLDAHQSQNDENFEKFYDQAYGKTWPGSKPLARETYDITVAKVGYEYLLEQKLAYFKFLSLPDNAFRGTMQAVEFLSPKAERYAEDWKGYIELVPSVIKEKIKEKENRIIPSQLTMEQKNKMYQ